MRHVAQIMGMPISIDIIGGEPGIFDKVFARLREIDERFSTYKTTSEVSRYQRGEVSQPSRELKMVIEACKRAEAATGGYFSAWADSSFDPSGYVKGWATNEAAKIIKAAGFNTFCIGAGGDILARSNSAKNWSIGIQDPRSKVEVVGVLRAKNFAVATSGNYERGAHIYNPKSGKLADELASFSVVGKDIIKADILATAGFSAGLSGLKLVEKQLGYEALAIDKTGRQFMTSGLQRLLS